MGGCKHFFVGTGVRCTSKCIFVTKCEERNGSEKQMQVPFDRAQGGLSAPVKSGVRNDRVFRGGRGW